MDDEGILAAGNGTKNSSASAGQVNLNPAQDVQLSDLDTSGNSVPFPMETVVHHVEHSECKNEGSSSVEEDRVARLANLLFYPLGGRF